MEEKFMVCWIDETGSDRWGIFNRNTIERLVKNEDLEFHVFSMLEEINTINF